MTKLFLIRGLPGSGKSTFAKKLLEGGLVDRHLETDKYFINEEGEYKFDPSKLKEYHALCQKEIKEALLAGESVVVSNTFTRIWEMQPYIDMAKDMEVELTVITAEGDYGNIHGVPQHAIDNMRERMEKYPGC